jgi:hypothetical protein
VNGTDPFISVHPGSVISMERRRARAGFVTVLDRDRRSGTGSVAALVAGSGATISNMATMAPIAGAPGFRAGASSVLVPS